MEISDIGAVGRLFNIAFRGNDRPASESFTRYFETLFFGSPSYSPQQGSLVHESAGGIDSALLSIPMRFVIGDRPLTGRLLCAFMSNGRKSGVVGAARLSRNLATSTSPFFFTDNASPVSADHWTAGGGDVLPIHSLEWRRDFRPFNALALRAARRRPVFGHGLIRSGLSPFDILARRSLPSYRSAPPPGIHVVPVELDRFYAHARPMTERFALRPAWDMDELDWLMRVAAMNTARGVLKLVEVRDGNERVVGCVLYFGKPGETALVLNVLTVAKREQDVVAAMFAHLDAEGYSAARGMAQPFFLNAILRQRRLTLKYGGFFCVKSPNAEIQDAIQRNDIYLGGLASESWSRLLTEF
ncbi:GNAT family N-acetyltransferase [Oryzicola mucosus]|uniref:GNAT family N-acetyltransferase n=1 Tax=Oryzicola mucosus TaxID=2767425 RepID=A0A8J6PUR6_9HYPH|nr:GNAT family N-acetyltransferase [Oryzicola mucosus]MBD0414931.1 GNAT family N-acetyltransferase [Oryzicola mucosus]